MLAGLYCFQNVAFSCHRIHAGVCSAVNETARKQRLVVWDPEELAIFGQAHLGCYNRLEAVRLAAAD